MFNFSTKFICLSYLSVRCTTFLLYRLNKLSVLLKSTKSFSYFFSNSSLLFCKLFNILISVSICSILNIFFSNSVRNSSSTDLFLKNVSKIFLIFCKISVFSSNDSFKFTFIFLKSFFSSSVLAIFIFLILLLILLIILLLTSLLFIKLSIKDLNSFLSLVLIFKFSIKYVTILSILIFSFIFKSISISFLFLCNSSNNCILFCSNDVLLSVNFVTNCFSLLPTNNVSCSSLRLVIDSSNRVFLFCNSSIFDLKSIIFLFKLSYSSVFSCVFLFISFICSFNSSIDSFI